ncbi:MAG: hypothetical protein AMXMBFR53_06910 [Gemmatimonadota bacterium]
MTTTRTPRPNLAALAVVAALLAGCDFVGRYLAGTPEDQLAQAALERWASPGTPFLDGASGRDTVASVSPTGARSWEVAVVPPEGGAPVVWALEVTRVETYAVFPGEAFGRFLSDRARELGMRTFLPTEVLSRMASGAVLGVGDLEVRYGPAQRGGRNEMARVAYLTPGGDGGETAWRIQDASRSANVLLQALQTVVEDMIRRDDRVLACMGSGTPASVPRAEQLACVRKVWTQEFGSAQTGSVK